MENRSRHKLHIDDVNLKGKKKKKEMTILKEHLRRPCCPSQARTNKRNSFRPKAMSQPKIA